MESYRVVLASRAARELREIFDYIARDSIQNAGKFVRALLEMIESLKDMPGRFKIERRYRRQGFIVHSTVVHPYLIFYRVVEATRQVVILSVWHGARTRPKSLD